MVWPPEGARRQRAAATWASGGVHPRRRVEPAGINPAARSELRGIPHAANASHRTGRRPDRPGRNVIYNMTVDEARALRRLRRRRRPSAASTAISPWWRRAAYSVRWPGPSAGRCATSSPSAPTGPCLIAADRIDAIHRLPQASRGWPTSSTRPTRAWSRPTTSPRSPCVGCPDPNPTYTPLLRPARATPCRPTRRPSARPTSARCTTRSTKWLRQRATDGPIGVCFSGGIDSGSVFLVAYHAMLRLGMSPARLKAFTLAVDGGGDDLAQARRFLDAVGLGLFLRADRGHRAGHRLARGGPHHRGLQAARRAVGGDGPGPVPRHPRALPRVALPASTATAATRTSRTTPSRRTPN